MEGLLRGAPQYTLHRVIIATLSNKFTDSLREHFNYLVIFIHNPTSGFQVMRPGLEAMKVAEIFSKLLLSMVRLRQPPQLQLLLSQPLPLCSLISRVCDQLTRLTLQHYQLKHRFETTHLQTHLEKPPAPGTSNLS